MSGSRNGSIRRSILNSHSPGFGNGYGCTAGRLDGCAKLGHMAFRPLLSADLTASALKTSEQTVLRDWKLARTWLAREMERGGGAGD